MSSWFCHLCHVKDFLGRLQKSAGHHMWPDDRESLSSQNYVPHNRNKDTK